MDLETIERILVEALMLAVLLSAVPLVSSMCVGALTSVFQAATQIQEQTLSFVPKLATVSLVLYFCGPWLAAELTSFSLALFDFIIQLSRGA